MTESASASARQRTALVLSGGGARGAYQAGLLSGLLEGHSPAVGTRPFEIFVGSSAGSINADDFPSGVSRLTEIWGGLEAYQVFRTDVASLGRIGVRWAWDLSFGGALRHVQPKALLDTAPLRELLARIPVERLDINIGSGSLRALAVAATDLYTGNGVLFVHGHPDIELWERKRWTIERAQISVDHLMASSAIPIFFPSIQIGRRHFGDGCIRNTSPLSPAIHLGADRIVAVGVQGPGRKTPSRSKKVPAPTIAEIAGVLLDAVMLDAIEVDVEHSERVNESIMYCRSANPLNPFRKVKVLWLSPSVDFGEIAAELADRVPPILRYLMRGLGPDEAITELLSYLLFDPEFCGRLIELGRKDAAASAPQIEEFLNE